MRSLISSLSNLVHSSVNLILELVLSPLLFFHRVHRPKPPADRHWWHGHRLTPYTAYI